MIIVTKCILIILLLVLISITSLLIINNLPSNKELFLPSDKELVIAVCNEDISWIVKYLSDYKLITIYNKCDKKITLKNDNIRIINTPNIGSCDYAYLSYIIDRYNNLPDYIDFTKGSLEPVENPTQYIDCPLIYNSINLFQHN